MSTIEINQRIALVFGQLQNLSAALFSEKRNDHAREVEEMALRLREMARLNAASKRSTRRVVGWQSALFPERTPDSRVVLPARPTAPRRPQRPTCRSTDATRCSKTRGTTGLGWRVAFGSPRRFRALLALAGVRVVSRRLQARRGNGQWQRNTLENTFGLPRGHLPHLPPFQPARRHRAGSRRVRPLRRRHGRLRAWAMHRALPSRPDYPGAEGRRVATSIDRRWPLCDDHAGRDGVMPAVDRPWDTPAARTVRAERVAVRDIIGERRCFERTCENVWPWAPIRAAGGPPTCKPACCHGRSTTVLATARQPPLDPGRTHRRSQGRVAVRAPCQLAHPLCPWFVWPLPPRLLFVRHLLLRPPMPTTTRSAAIAHTYPGTLIAFEGLDGSGKSTQARLLADALTSAGRRVVLTREPTDGTWGTLIRSTAREGRRLAPLDELDAFLKDRAEHVSRVIRPALERGDVVITDRYYHSTIAYQGSVFLPVELGRRTSAHFLSPTS